MNNNAFSRVLVAAVAMLVVGGAQVVRAQVSDGSFETKPPLALAVPFTERDGGVGVEYSVLLNQRAVLAPDHIMRVIYNPPRADDAEVLAQQARANREIAYTKTHKLKQEKPLTATELAVLKIARETHWPHITMFQLALANTSSKDMRVVYFNPANKEEFYDETLELIDGMLVGNKGGRFVDVLAVERGSRADAAGIEPGDKIREVGRTAAQGDLIAFATEYNKVKKASALSSAGGVRLMVENEEGNLREIVLKAPTSASLNTGVMDITLDDLGVSEDQPKKEAPPMPEVGTWKEEVYQKVKDKTGVDPNEVLQPGEATPAEPDQADEAEAPAQPAE